MNKQNKKLMRFLHEVIEEIPPQERLLDIGTGPTIYQLVSPSKKVAEIHCSDYSTDARQELEKWFSNSPDCFNWESYFKFQLQLEGREFSKEVLDELRTRLRSSLGDVHFCNIFSEKVIPEREEKFPLVTSFFCPESVSTNQNEFQQSMKNILNTIRKDGHLLMALLRNASYWRAGNQRFNSYALTKGELRTFLEKNGADIRRLKTTEVNEKGDMDGHIMVWAEV